ncbi:hypothetical protein EIP91_000255 [Steccherinum ochraceum]|uniref:Macrofage activating glycoprotein n=1 Tax=Steccherinum ochraceum TaxID=92696 RepID=A0A4R0RWR2_9APHY|nr:hypothetical protein EIP91_000255 [Steccherinum ochraceum]
MAPSALYAAVVVATASYAAAQQTLQFPATPLNALSFPKPTDAPYQVYPASVPYVRGPQTGYNICNSTTEGPTSDCQTMYFNGLDDFCLWGPPNPNTTIGDSEGEVVAHCSKKGHGTRILNNGLFKSAQILKTDQYWMITGTIDQTLINIADGDPGGELDSGGQDARGNPIGGLVYSNAFSTDGSPSQIQWWTEFIGSNQFCLKICKPGGNVSGYCQHTLDRIGLAYNCPSKYTIGGGAPDGVFETCDSDLMGVPGVYVQNGQTLSYQQPAETVPIGDLPYQPTLVASRNCVTTASTALFTDLNAAPTSSPASTSSGASASPTGSSSGASSGSPSKTSSGSPSQTGASQSGSDAAATRVSVFATIFGVFAAVAFLA